MSKPMTFLRKIKLFRLYLKTQKGGVIVTCGFCDSTNISFKRQDGGKVDGRVVYESRYKCNDCGAFCDNVQSWEKS